MKNALLLGTVVGAMLVSSSVMAAVILPQDGDFEGAENGTLSLASSPWYSPSGGNVAINSANPHTGSFGAVLTSETGESAVLLQNVSATASTEYAIDFWLAAPGGGGTISVALNGGSAGSLVIASGTAYTEYTLTTTATTGSGNLSFIWHNTQVPGTSADIDDISVTPVPEPSTIMAGALMLVPFAASTFKLRKKSVIK